MRVRTELAAGVGALLFIQVVTSLSAIGLLGRMAPAIDRLVLDNVTSTEIAGEAITTIALAGEAFEPNERAQLQRLLASARDNITEDAERPIVEALEKDFASLFDGDAGARGRVIEGFRKLGAINRERMGVAGGQATRLGVAGAWTMVGLSVGSFALSVWYSRRFARRIEEPIAEIHDALRDFSQGQRFRRSVVVDAPLELIEIGDRLQMVFDRASIGGGTPDDAFSRADRAALLHLLDASSDVRVVVDSGGTILAANRAAHDRFGAPDGTILRTCLHRVATGEVESPRWDMVDVGEGARLISEHRSASESRGSAP